MSAQPHVATVEIHAKKNSSRLTRWHVSKDIPYPRIGDRFGLYWDQADSLLDKNPNIGDTYRCRLLRSDLDLDKDRIRDDRHAHAGYSPGYIYDKEKGHNVPLPETPGSIIYRGQSLGETSIEIRPGLHGGRVSIQVRGFSRATGSEADFLQNQVVPALAAFIESHKSSLHSEAVDKLRNLVQDRLDKAKEELKKAEDQMLAAIAKL